MIHYEVVVENGSRSKQWIENEEEKQEEEDSEGKDEARPNALTFYYSWRFQVTVDSSSLSCIVDHDQDR